MLQLHPLSAPSNDVPNDILGNPFAPGRSMTANSPKNPARWDPGGRHPSIGGGLYPRSRLSNLGSRGHLTHSSRKTP
jgi:hypothetical protein